MIDLFYKTILTVLNKNQRGKISPLEFNNNVNQSIQKIYTELFGDFRKLNFRKSKSQSTSNYGDEAGNVKQAIEHYIKSIDLEEVSGFYNLPKDCMLINALYSEDTEIEKVDALQFNRLKRSKRMLPNVCSPIYCMLGQAIDTLPVEDKISLLYYRKPKYAKWTYRIVNGTEMFAPDQLDYQDLDIHPLMMQKLFVETLYLCGLNLREQEIQQYLQLMKQEEAQNEN